MDRMAGIAQYIAKGDMAMTWDFANREGQLDITNFDGINASAFVFDPGGDNPTGRFQGNFDSIVSGHANGAFVNDGPNVAAGVIGDFSLQGQGVQAVGTFAGVGTASGGL